MRETFSANKKQLLTLAVMAGAALLISVGVWINNSILNGAEQKARNLQTALQTKTDPQFNYAIDTKQGRVLASVTVKAVDLVHFPEMNKSFSRVKKTEEKYTRHTREVCETHYRSETRTRSASDSKGHTRTQTYTEQVPYQVCHTEIYYSWDFVDSSTLTAKEVEMAGRKYSIEKFALSDESIDAKHIIEGAKGRYMTKEADHWVDLSLFGASIGDIRYSYSVLQLPKTGTVYLNVSGGVQSASGGKITLSPDSATKLVKDAQNSAHNESLGFTIFWSILVLGEIIAGLYRVWFYEPSAY